MANISRTLTTLITAGLLTTMTMQAQASEKELLNVLLENGVISKGQYKALEKKFAKSNNTHISTKGGIKAKSADGKYKFQFGGRVMVDAGYSNEDVTSLESGTEFRRLRLFAKGKLHKDWGYKVQLDFSDNKVAIKDGYIKYIPLNLTIGNFKQPMSLEELTSSKYTTFMERSLPTVFAISRRMGVGMKRGGDNWSLAGSVYGGQAQDAESGQEGYGFAARASFAPIAEKTRAVHFGAAISREEPLDDANTIRFRQRPEFHAASTRLVDTGTLTNVDNIQRYGLEAATVMGPFSLQGEYLQVSVNRSNGSDDVDFNGSYVTASYFLTGESRPYKAKKGTFGRVKPKSKSGAWEVAARYSTIDLNDGTVNGGEEDNWTLGLNWYVNPQVRIMANYVDVNVDKAGVSDNPNIFAVRAQIDF